MNSISFTRAPQLKEKPKDENSLGHGRIFTDYMFEMDYLPDKGWHGAKIVPYAPISLDPATTCLHYGQLIFEGMKAYRADDDRILLFRPKMNMSRMNESAKRMCIPPVDEAFLLEAIAKHVDVEREWVPRPPGTSLYIRPFILSTDSFLGVYPSKSYKFLVILSSAGHYFPGGLTPLKIYVEDEYVRAVRGGAGYAKCAGNYAASLAAQMKAQEFGYSQVLWLDGVERKYIDEVGQMNVFFIIEGKAITPMLNGSILAGVTRDSSIALMRSWGIPVEERLISIQEIAEASKSGKLEEAFGCGTASVIAPIGEFKWGETIMNVNNGKIGATTQRLYDTLIGVQRGALEDPFGWTYEVGK